MRRVLVLGLAALLLFALAVPAFAVNGSGGAGAGFGLHHATHAEEMTGFTAEENPGRMHRGFSGWTTE